MTKRSIPQRGAALIISLAVIVGLSAVAGTYLTASFNGTEMSARELDATRARIAADEGLHLAAIELRTGVDGGGDGLGNIATTGPDGRQITVTASDLGGGLFRLRSVGTLPRASLASEMLVQVEPSEILGALLRAAVTAEGPVTTLGTIEIDGRDWDYVGGAIVGAGVFGISTVGSISNGGASTVGGNGIAPVGNPGPLAQEEFAMWADGIDNDGDGSVDEESYDGLDNDGDGEVDEDVNEFPQNPDAVVGAPPGTLAQIAQAMGTYFSTEAALDAWIAANGGNVPGGAIIYADFQEWQPVDFGPTLNDPPSIIVHHNAAGDAQMKNIHGEFRGLIICDRVQHLNGDFSLLGGLISLADEAYGNAFGNGSALVRYSSTALGELPSAGGLNRVTVVSWSRASTN